jgi:Protein kinase domain
MDNESPVTQGDANESFFSPSITVKDELELDSPSSRRVKLIPTHLRQKSFARGGKGALDFASKKGPLDRAAEMPEPDVPQEEVLAKCGMKPSAAFPTGMDNIGPHNFRKLKLLGKGGAGTVYLVNLRGTDLVYAMKELTKEDMIKGDKVLRVMTEREILATANHPFIVTMYATFQTSSRLCFVMDYAAGGELRVKILFHPRPLILVPLTQAS